MFAVDGHSWETVQGVQREAIRPGTKAPLASDGEQERYVKVNESTERSKSMK